MDMQVSFPLPLHSRPFPLVRPRQVAPRVATARRASVEVQQPPQTLHGELAELLAPVAAWGRVELSLRNRMAEMHSALDRVSCDEHGADIFHMGSDRQAVWLSERGVARVEMVGAHSGPVGLQWFDRRGQSLGSMLLPSAGGRDQALLWLGQHGRPRADAGRRRRAAAPVPVMFAPLSNAAAVDPLARGPGAASWAAAALLQAERAVKLRLDMGGPGVCARYTGPLAALAEEAGGYRASGRQCRLQLQPQQASAASRVVDGDGASGLLLTDDAGGSLLLHPLGRGAAGWFAGVAARAAALSTIVAPLVGHA